MAFHSVQTNQAPWGTYSTEMNENATEVYSVLYHTYGWTLEAVCGALGNMTHESYINPAQFQTGYAINLDPWVYRAGVGFIQFTAPAPSPDGTIWPNPWLYWCQQNNKQLNDGYEQLYLVANAEDPDIQSMGLSTGIWGWLKIFNVSLAEYARSTQAPATLAEIFYQNMEYHGGSGDTSLPTRQQYANHWYQYFTGVVPPDPGPGPGPGPTPTGRKKMPFWFYLKNPYKRG